MTIENRSFKIIICSFKKILGFAKNNTNTVMGYISFYPTVFTSCGSAWQRSWFMVWLRIRQRRLSKAVATTTGRAQNAQYEWTATTTNRHGAQLFSQMVIVMKKHRKKNGWGDEDGRREEEGDLSPAAPFRASGTALLFCVARFNG